MNQLRISAIALCLALAMRAAPALGLSVSLTSLEGKDIEGELVSLTAESVVIGQGEEIVAVPLEKILRLQPKVVEPVQNIEAAFVGLTDGSRLPITNVTVQNRLVKVSSPLSDGELRIPADEVAWIDLRPPVPAAAEYVQSILNQEQAGDCVVIQKGDPPQFDHLSGVLGDINETSVKFDWDGESIDIKRTKLAAVVFHHSRGTATQSEQLVVSTKSGARLQAQAALFAEGSDKLQVVLAGGQKLTVPVDAVKLLDCSSGKVVELSALQPLKQEWTPLIALPVAAELIVQHGLPRGDQSFRGSKLSLWWPGEGNKKAGEIRDYETGLAVRSRTELVYRVPTGAKEFRALAGIDPECRSQGSVVLRIEGDRKLLWEDSINGQSIAPAEITVNLTDVKRLRITVDYGENLDFGDRLHLVEARIWK